MTKAGEDEESFVAQYNTKDLILYALSVGCDPDDLEYVYEGHEDFRAFPTFPLVFPFIATRRNGPQLNGVRPFPPPAMTRKDGGMLPPQFLKGDDSSVVPVIHIAQSIRLHRPIPLPLLDEDDAPIHTNLEGGIVSVTPKTVGTFIVTETKIYQNSDNSQKGTTPLLCTLSSTALLLGLDPDEVNAMPPKTAVQGKRSRPGTKPDAEFTVPTASTQALLYRLTGDYNSIHVEPSPLETSENSNKPIMHGLCTLGIATRAVIRYWKETRGVDRVKQVTLVEGTFTKPVNVGDTLQIRIWEVPANNNIGKQQQQQQQQPPGIVSVLFEVFDVDTQNVVMKGGYVEAECIPESKL